MDKDGPRRPVELAIRGAVISMMAIIAYTEVAGFGAAQRQAHLSAYLVALSVAFVAHYAFAWLENRNA